MTLQVKQSDLDKWVTEISRLADINDQWEAKLKRIDIAGGNAADADKTAVHKALGMYARSEDETELRDMSIGDQEHGGYLVNPVLDNTIRSIAKDKNQTRAYASNLSIDSDSFEVVLDISDVQAEWVSEKGSRPVTDGPNLKKQAYNLAEIYASPIATRKVLDMAPQDLGSWLENKISDAFSQKEERDFVLGDGIDKPKGWLTVDTDNKKDFERTWGKVQHIAAGATNPSDEQLADALVKMSLTLRSPYRSNAVWFMSREAAIRLRQVKDANKHYLWVPGLQTGQVDTLLGFPVVFNDHMPEIASGNLPVALADWSQFFLCLDRPGTRFERDPISVKGSVVFYAYKRTTGGVMDYNAAKFLKISAN